jgi:hypothetical protein
MPGIVTCATPNPKGAPETVRQVLSLDVRSGSFASIFSMVRHLEIAACPSIPHPPLYSINSSGTDVVTS